MEVSVEVEYSRTGVGSTLHLILLISYTEYLPDRLRCYLFM
jgi:hypothetical protein